MREINPSTAGRDPEPLPVASFVPVAAREDRADNIGTGRRLPALDASVEPIPRAVARALLGALTTALARTGTCPLWPLLLVAGTPIAIYLWVALSRIGYPFELEWMEGGMVLHVARVLSGLKLYVEPSLTFTPFIYPPFYYFVSAGMAQLLGLGFLPLRLVSLISSLGSLALIFMIVRLETGTMTPAVLGAGLFAGTFPLSGGWFDIGRADSLFLCLLLCGVYLMRLRPSVESHILAGAVFTLAFHTKQTALPIFVPVAAYVAATERTRGACFVVALLAGMLGSIAALSVVYGRWYGFYVLSLPFQHAVERSMAAGFWTYDLYPLAVACALGVFLFLVVPPPSFKLDKGFYLALAVGAVGGSWASRLHTGGYPNSVMPAYAVLSILFALGLHQGLSLAELGPTKPRLMLRGACILGCAAQFIFLAYNPAAFIPTQTDERAGRELVSRISNMNGEVYVSHHPYLAVQAGKAAYTHIQALDDVLRGRDGIVKDRLYCVLAEARRQVRFSAIVSDGPLPRSLVGNVYRPAIRLVPRYRGASWPVTGSPKRPAWILLPDTNTAAGEPERSQ